MDDEQQRAEVLQVATDALAHYGIAPEAEPPPSVRRFVLNLGKAVNSTMQHAEMDPEALRWMAGTLRTWEHMTGLWAERSLAGRVDVDEAAAEFAEDVERLLDPPPTP